MFLHHFQYAISYVPGVSHKKGVMIPGSVSVYSCPAIHCLAGPIQEGKEEKAEIYIHLSRLQTVTGQVPRRLQDFCVLALQIQFRH